MSINKLLKREKKQPASPAIVADAKKKERSRKKKEAVTTVQYEVGQFVFIKGKLSKADLDCIGLITSLQGPDHIITCAMAFKVPDDEIFLTVLTLPRKIVQPYSGNALERDIIYSPEPNAGPYYFVVPHSSIDPESSEIIIQYPSSDILLKTVDKANIIPVNDVENLPNLNRSFFKGVELDERIFLSVMEDEEKRELVEPIPVTQKPSEEKDRYFAMIEIALIEPHPDNPRRRRIRDDEPSMIDLVDSIRANGVLQSVVVRRHPEKQGYFQLCLGHRRLRASTLAGRSTIPAIIHEGLDDARAIEFMVVENLQRENLAPLEESENLQRLLNIGWDQVTIARNIGKTTSWVTRRVSLLLLSDNWKQALIDGATELETWGAGHLEEVSRLPDTVQNDLLEIVKDRVRVRTLGDLRNTIARLTRQLSHASWDLSDQILVREAGSCRDCTKHSLAQNALFPEINTNKIQKSICLDGGCFSRKLSAYVKKQVGVQGGVSRVIIVFGDNYDESIYRVVTDEYRSIYKASWEYQKCKETDDGARPIICVAGNGAGNILGWGRLNSHQSGGGLSQATDRKKKEESIEIKKARFTAQKRGKVFCEMIREHIQILIQDPAPILEADPILLSRLVLTFGTIHKNDNYYGFTDYRGQYSGNAIQTLYAGVCKEKGDVLMRLIFESVMQVVLERISKEKYNSNLSCNHLDYEFAEWVAPLLGIDPMQVWEVAAQMKPYPKSYAQNNSPN